MSDRLSVRVDEESKQAASEVLNKLGMSMSTAINLYFRQIQLKKGIPFEISLPNAAPSLVDTMQKNAKAAIREEVQKLQDNRLPLAMYDNAIKKPYMLYPDGRKEYLNDDCTS